jgi:AbrB family looped-hinge helix DNA binding protein
MWKLRHVELCAKFGNMPSEEFGGIFAMGHETCIVKIAANGRLSVPAKQRKQLGLENGGLVVLRVEGGDLHIRPVKAVLADLQERVRRALPNSHGVVDRFIADRRKEAATDPQS